MPDTVSCPNCNKHIVVRDVPEHEFQKADQHVVRTKVVFLDKAKGTVKAKCTSCGEIVDLPFQVMEKGGL